ncbi:MAG: NUDIX domain-containing protein [Planctomycetota bacterium]
MLSETSEFVDPTQAAGMVIFSETQPPQFLLMQHRDRWDLPKGHAEPGESLLETALRETEEETGIARDQLRVDETFRFVLEYYVEHSKRGRYPKRVTYFLARVSEPCEINLTEHIGYEWRPWPTGPVQTETIDPLLSAVKTYWEERI